MRFVAAPEFPVFPTRERPLSPYEAVVAAVAQTRPAVAECAPDVVVHDILTLAPALSGELERVPVATLVPHLYPPGEPGFPPFGFGARPARTGVGRRLWRAFDRPVAAGLRRGTDELIDMVSLCGPAAVVAERLAAFRDAGVGTLVVSPMAFDLEGRLAQLRAIAELNG